MPPSLALRDPGIHPFVLRAFRRGVKPRGAQRGILSRDQPSGTKTSFDTGRFRTGRGGMRARALRYTGPSSGIDDPLH
ncbi:hypothetical protein F2P81_007875 [Scophthalmus maximus]|uniref:Uncharacterized protein n=1 Tax=Scophthalmus maximus TaxID=52904 RepID=A0A6A4T6N4_SCOMX|nr:hypothetical protein F2P81_007875 [Scophthalmus maximus]